MLIFIHDIHKATQAFFVTCIWICVVFAKYIFSIGKPHTMQSDRQNEGPFTHFPDPGITIGCQDCTAFASVYQERAWKRARTGVRPVRHSLQVRNLRWRRKRGSDIMF